MATLRFLAHLVNQQVAHELLALEVLYLLLERPTEDSVELAAMFTRECGKLLAEVAARPLDRPSRPRARSPIRSPSLLMPLPITMACPIPALYSVLSSYFIFLAALFHA